MRADSFIGQVLTVLSRRTPAFTPLPGEPQTFAGHAYALLRRRPANSTSQPGSVPPPTEPTPLEERTSRAQPSPEPPDRLPVIARLVATSLHADLNPSDRLRLRNHPALAALTRTVDLAARAARAARARADLARARADRDLDLALTARALARALADLDLADLDLDLALTARALARAALARARAALALALADLDRADLVDLDRVLDTVVEVVEVLAFLTATAAKSEIIPDDPGLVADRGRADYLAEIASDLAAARTDFTQADLRDATFTSVDLEGVRWSAQTRWPPGWAERVEQDSIEVAPGIFEIRRGGIHNRVLT
ncbi:MULTISPECIES: hypothetical protein [unclassified Frankia]|uniref:hypothetical protein n=1 Tax=unclassified Frankia TaxID=2632575 RepID=UPI002AD36798|nr:MULTISPECIES: hypothetical protein [unclassified Frankia]